MPLTSQIPQHDFSKGKRFEELRRMLREQRTVLENAAIGIALIKQRTVVRCNYRFAEIYDYPNVESIVGLSSVSLYADQEAFECLGHVAYATMASGVAYHTEIQMRRKSGRLFWAHLTGRFVDVLNTEEGAIWIVDDISARMDAQIQLQAVLVEQNLILDNAMVGIVFLHDRIVTRCNAAFEIQFGYEPGELKGMSSRQWYLTDEDWEEGGRRCYAPLVAGRTFQGEMTLRKKGGAAVFFEVRAKAIDPSNLSLGSIWITMDITARKDAEQALLQVQADLEQLVAQRTQELQQTVAELKQRAHEQRIAEKRIQRLAHFDGLTGLPNRLLLTERWAQVLSAASAAKQQVAVMFLDLDHFKNINDSLGHSVGDRVLVLLAERLQASVCMQDTVSRLGGDEFILLLVNTDASSAAKTAEALLQTVMLPFQIEQHELTVTPSVGIALYPQDGGDLDSLLRCADAAMYTAKDDGRNNYRFYTSAIQAQSDRNLLLSNALRRALQRDQLQLYYQPQIDMATGGLVGAEALLRWSHPELGWVSPAEFIPIAEGNGLIIPIGEWVLRTAMAQLAQWQNQGLPAITMAVNLSVVQFRHPDLPQLVSDILKACGLPAERLELELTEGVAMTHPAAAIAVMNDLRQRGIRMAIDDFGTGYSSLSYLKRFQVSKLKIDQSFVRDITEDSDDKAIVGAIISMAKSLGIQTIAEGVETEGQLAFLRSRGCDEVQGYYFSRPLDVHAFTAYLRQRS